MKASRPRASNKEIILLNPFARIGPAAGPVLYDGKIETRNLHWLFLSRVVPSGSKLSPYEEGAYPKGKEFMLRSRKGFSALGHSRAVTELETEPRSPDSQPGALSIGPHDFLYVVLQGAGNTVS